MNAPSADKRIWVPLFWLLTTGALVCGFYASGTPYGGYRLPASGVNSIHPQEMVFFGWYGLFAGMGICSAFAFFYRTPVPALLEKIFTFMVARPRESVAGAAALLVLLAILFRYLVLLGEPVTDDELTYRFIAQTLLNGHLVNKTPIDPEFLRNQFIIVGESGWFGKYSIGHPLFLALGELFSLRTLVVPLLSAGSMLFTFSIGKRLFSLQVSLAGTLLLLASPQFVWTSATELSQPTELFCILSGTWCLLKISSDSRLRWALLGGLAWGLAILVRPMPGVLCVLVAGIAFLDVIRRAPSANRHGRILELAISTGVISLVAGLILVTNYAQSGDLFRSGVHLAHPNGIGSALTVERISASLGGALMRQSVWLFGVPLSFLFVPCARPRRGQILFWGMITAVYAYRVLVPKTVVSTTGPIYVFEAIPFLCLATAAGVAKMGERLKRCTHTDWARAIYSLLLATTFMSVCLFTPVVLKGIMTGAYARGEVTRQLSAAGASDQPVLIFSAKLVDSKQATTWAYTAPNPSPDLTDQVLFLRPPGDSPDEFYKRAVQLWQSEFPHRRAFYFGMFDGEMLLRELRPTPE